ALLFARRGWRIGAFDLDEAGLARLREEIGDDLCLTGRLDVRDAAAYREQVAAFGDWTGGRMDVLFNCAGIMRMGPFDQVPLEEHVRTVEVNVLGVLNGIYLSFGLL